MTDKIRKILGALIAVGGTCFSAYVGFWLMFIKPILNCCAAFDAKTLTAVQIFWTIIKCYLGSSVFAIIAYICIMLGICIFQKDDVK